MRTGNTSLNLSSPLSAFNQCLVLEHPNHAQFISSHLLTAALVATLLSWTGLGRAQEGAADTAVTAPQDQAMQQRLDRFRQVEDVMAIIEREYLTSIDRQRLWSGAFNGMSQVLDRHSYYSDQRSAVMYVPGADQTAREFG